MNSVEKEALFAVVLLLLASLYASAQEHSLREVWQYSVDGDGLEVFIYDLDDDGLGEVILGSVYKVSYGRSSTLTALDRSGYEKWDYRIAGELFDLAISNSSGETLVLVGAQSMGYAINPSGGAAWKYFNQGKDIIYFYSKDLDNDGSVEYMAGSASGIQGSALLLIDSQGKPLKTIRLTHRDVPNRITSYDLDSDGVEEIIVGGISGSVNSVGKTFERVESVVSAVYAFNFNGTQRWRNVLNSAVTFLQAGDFNGDGKAEVIAASNDKLWAFDEIGEEIWTADIAGYVRDGFIGDINGDGIPEIVVASDRVYVFDLSGNTIWSSQRFGEIRGLKPADLDGDGLPELIAGYSKLRILGNNGEVIDTIDGLGNIENLAVGDLEEDGFPEIAVSTDSGILYLMESKSFTQGEEADSYYRKALEFFEEEDYEKATEYSIMATNLYQAMGQAKEESNAKKIIERIDEVKEGKELFTDASDAYSIKSYQIASEKSKEAWVLFTNAQYSKGIGEAFDILNESSLYVSAYQALEVAENYSADEKHPETITLGRQAAQLFEQLGEFDLMSDANSLVSRADKFIAAANILEDGKNFYADGDLVNAKGRALRAREIYTELEDGSGIERANELAERIEVAQGGGSWLPSLTFSSIHGLLAIVLILFLLVILAAAVLVYLFIRRRRGSNSHLEQTYKKKGFNPKKKRKKHLSSLNP
ncbi:MAG: VCBS repeat-containing protein [Candidatus Altiarchaeota archaeon]